MNSDRRPFRFGVQFQGPRASGSGARAEWSELAKKAEVLGYDILLMPDHFGGQLAIGPALAVAAEATTTLRIGSLVLQNDLRHPALVAMEAATLDLLSGGRFELGIGAGGSFLPDYEWTGIPLNPAAMRVKRLGESLKIIKGLLAEGSISFNGRYYTAANLPGGPAPIQQPHPPLLVGGGGPRMLSLAAREADIVSIFPTMLPDGGRFNLEELRTIAVAKKVDLIRRVAGDRFPRLELNILVQKVVVTDNRQAGIEQLTSEWTIPVDDWLDSPHVFIGTTAEIVDNLKALRAKLGLSYFVVFADCLDVFAPVVAELAGG
jgi:probable F420-dependent oxidoreductase